MTVAAPPPALAYLPYFDLTGQPHVIADGQPRKSTVLTLSHWPASGTPLELLADLSAEIVLRYLSTPAHHVEDVRYVSNNHFDIDGFMSVWALCHPSEALADAALVAEVARAGDFGWTSDMRAARVAWVLAVMRDPAHSPLPASTFAAQEPLTVAALHRELLARFADLAGDIDAHESLWGEEQRRYDEASRAFREGRISIDEAPDVDLAIVHVAPDVPGRGCCTSRATTPRWSIASRAGCSTSRAGCPGGST